MNYKLKMRNLLSASMVLTGIVMFSCKEDLVEPKSIVDGDATQARAVYSQRSVNWDNHANGTYTSSAASGDFGNVGGWVDSRAYISSGTCRITLLKNALSGAGGIVSTIDISDGSAYELDYDIKYHSQFDWSTGGKVGFGFGIGEGNAGGDPGWDGNGGSMRIMWYNTGSRVFFQPYLYYRDQPGKYGDTFGSSYPSSGSINKSQWYHVHMYLKSNTGSNTNGHAQIIINGQVILERDIRWTTNDSKRLINTLWFMTFRGGSESYWQSSTDGYIYYDNMTVNKISG